MPGLTQQNRGQDGAYSNPNVEPAQQDTLRKVGQVLATLGVTPPQAPIPEVIPAGETDNQRRERRAGIAEARALQSGALARGQASTANAEGAQLGGDGQPGVGRGDNPGQHRRIPGSSPFNHTKDPPQ